MKYFTPFCCWVSREGSNCCWDKC